MLPVTSNVSWPCVESLGRQVLVFSFFPGENLVLLHYIYGRNM
jgi:hypothetical protein